MYCIIIYSFILEFIFCRCFKFTVNDHCSRYNLATNDYVYRYTSAENFEQLSGDIQQAVPPLVSLRGTPSICHLALNLLLCNVGFNPCDLTTGTPKPVCSKFCFYVRENCQFQYEFASSSAPTAGIPFVTDCNNTLKDLELSHGVEFSSDDFGNNCLDFDLESKDGHNYVC